MSTLTSKDTAILVPSERPRGPAQPRLIVIAGAELGRHIRLTDDPVEIGRGEQATVRIDSDGVSRRHASIQRVAGQFVLADLGSTNGTYVNDEKVQTRALADGDRIRIGKSVLKYSECSIEAQYHEQIFNLASIDALTGAYNKRYFSDIFDKVFSENLSRGRPLSLVLFDIDHFKRINDTHGHSAGDVVLREVAEVALQQKRDSDLFCRVGGEEFAFLLPDTDLKGARHIAERIREAVQRTKPEVSGATVRVTVSLGVAERQQGEGTSGLYERADQRLYEAKRSGRNQVR